MPLRRNRRQYEQLTDFDRGRIIGLREAGWSNRRIGRPLGRSDMVALVLATVDHRSRVATSAPNNVASIDSTPLTSFQTSSAIKRKPYETETAAEVKLEKPTSAKTLTTDPTS
ncbi:hypothetical protein TNCV_2114281 [Trichonephila clavipes]|nr:hypothetical protein TNCV_2114281 [Trichonephila clavipes]